MEAVVDNVIIAVLMVALIVFSAAGWAFWSYWNEDRQASRGRK